MAVGQKANISDRSEVRLDQSHPRRIGLRDIADKLGISQTAVSFAINNRPGVSEETRTKVLQTAHEMGWTPTYAARALGSSKTMTIGFAPARAKGGYQGETFTLDFMAGVHLQLARKGYSLLFRPCTSMDEEMSVYRTWGRGKRVDGVILMDFREGDPRPKLLHEIGLPAVLAGGPDPSGIVPSLSIDDAQTMKTVLSHLDVRGYRRIAYLAGDGNLDYCRARVRSFNLFAKAHNISKTWVEYTDFSTEETIRITQRLLTEPDPPDAYIYETDTVASVSTHTIAEQLADGTYPACLPGAVSFEDSIYCRNSFPSMTAVHRDAGEYGRQVAGLMLKRLSGHPVSGNRKILTPTLLVRESTRPRKPRF